MGTLLDHFADLPDPRVERTKRHKLIDILVIAICSVICGAETWTEMEVYGRAKEVWLRTFLELPHGIPSHDTFRRVLMKVRTSEFQSRFLDWVREAVEVVEGEVVAVDGKTLRRSHRRREGIGPIHMVSAWACANRMVVGQVKTDEKSNEITAIPELLKVLEVAGCIVTIDAMGCQREIAETIVEREADYVLALKGNQGTLHADVNLFFEEARARGFKDVPHTVHRTVEKDHGRLETRRAWATEAIEWLDPKGRWAGLRSVVMVESRREIDDAVTTETEAVNSFV